MAGHKLTQLEGLGKYHMHLKPQKRETVKNGGACGKPREEMVLPESFHSHISKNEFVKSVHKQYKIATSWMRPLGSDLRMLHKAL